MRDQYCPNISPYTWDNDLIESVKKNHTPEFMCYPFKKKALVAGWGSDISEEIHLDPVLTDDIPIFRRQGGGCSVFLDPGNLIVSAVFPAPGFLNISHHFNQCTRWLIKGLKRTGLKNIYQDGISDIVLDNQKIGGTCLKRWKDFVYFSASILVSLDLYLLEKYLKHPLRQPEYRKNRTHRDFLTSIDRYHPEIQTLDFSLLLADSLKTEELT